MPTLATRPDKKKRYPVDTKAHVKAALAYLAQKSNAAKYTAAQLKRVMGRIRAAAKKFGITVCGRIRGLVVRRARPGVRGPR